MTSTGWTKSIVVVVVVVISPRQWRNLYTLKSENIILIQLSKKRSKFNYVQKEKNDNKPSSDVSNVMDVMLLQNPVGDFLRCGMQETLTVYFV